MNRRRTRIVLLGGLIALGIGSLWAQDQSGPTVTVVKSKHSEAHLVSRVVGRRSPIVEAVDRVKAAVVNIHSERTINQAKADLFSLSQSQSRVNGMGTGIVIDTRGYVITNQHVVEDVNSIRIALADGHSYNARVLARNHEMDLALLKVDTRESLPTIPIGTASDLMVGETVIAIGNAYGYEHTVSVGVVSALKRDVSLNKDMSYKSVIQTDASINPGNSGGPLINIHGDLVGVNVAIRAGAQGIGFAIPVDTVVRVGAEMLRRCRRNGIYDGMACYDHLDRTADGVTRTVIIDRVDGPASSAGLRTGDELLQVADQRVNNSMDVERALIDRFGGERIPVVVRRSGKEERIEISLLSNERPRTPVTGDAVWTRLGLQLSPVASDVVARVKRELRGGLEVMAVNAGSLAAKAGIKRGDILIGLHQFETVTVDHVLYVLNQPEMSSNNPLAFFIVRDGQVQKGWIKSAN